MFSYLIFHPFFQGSQLTPFARTDFTVLSFLVYIVLYFKLCFCLFYVAYWGGSVAEWLECWTQAQKGLVPNRSRDAVG